MAFNIQGGAHCCALGYKWASLFWFCEDDGSTAIVGTRSLGGRSVFKLTPPRSLAGRFGVWFGICTVAAHPGSYR